MKNEHRQHLLDEHMETELTELFNRQAEAKGEELWQAYLAAEAAGEIPEIPEDLDAECREIIQSADKTQVKVTFQKCIWNGMKRAAAVALVILPIASVLVMNVDAVKVPLLNFYLENKGHYSSFVIGRQPQSSERESSIANHILSTSLPNDYEYKDKKVSPDGTGFLLFSNRNDAQLYVMFNLPNGSINLDTENAESVSLQLNNYDALYIKKNGHRVVWIDSERNIVFDVYATSLNENEFWEYVYRLAT